MGYVHYLGGQHEYRNQRDTRVGGYALKCYECNRHTDRWVAAELPNAAEDMAHAMDLFHSKDKHWSYTSSFYSFSHSYRISFPDCGHQDVRPDMAIWRFYMFGDGPSSNS